MGDFFYYLSFCHKIMKINVGDFLLLIVSN